MYLTIQGIVLRVTDYNDKDALLTMLTRRHGRLTVKARGLRRKNSPLIAPCQLLSYGEFTLFEYRGQYTIDVRLYPRPHRLPCLRQPVAGAVRPVGGYAGMPELPKP